MLTKIGDAASQYNVSGRSLRYWEDAGILKSVRGENGYRFYNTQNLLRIEQIIVLRNLKLSIQDIQNIFTSGTLIVLTEILSRHLEDTRYAAEELLQLEAVLKHLLKEAKSDLQLSDVLSALSQKELTLNHDQLHALQENLIERKSALMNQFGIDNTPGDVRIVKLPKMTFASYCVPLSKTPEDDCWKVINQFISENNLDQQNGFRHFGFNNPDPTEAQSEYGYEMWVAVPPEMEIPQPLKKKTFEGGLFGALPTHMGIIWERYQVLRQWIGANDKYEMDWAPEADRRWLEECIDYTTFTTAGTPITAMQLDLLVPIKKRM